MNARRYGRRAASALLPLACAAFALPAVALASSGSGSGGGGLSGGASPVAAGPGSGAGAGTTGSGSGGSAATQSANAPVSTSGGGITLSTTASVMLRRDLSLSGTARGATGETIEIERSGLQTGWRWTPTVQTTAGSGGSFHALWHTSAAGRFAVRAIVVSRLASTASVTPSLTVTVYRASRATLYGPGFYGRRTACGARLTRSTLGVANRTLRCGTSVSLSYHGRTLTVAVIDRGPYANGADWDLTMATGRALGMDGTSQLGAVSLGRARATAAGRHGAVGRTARARRGR